MCNRQPPTSTCYFAPGSSTSPHSPNKKVLDTFGIYDDGGPPVEAHQGTGRSQVLQPADNLTRMNRYAGAGEKGRMWMTVQDDDNAAEDNEYLEQRGSCLDTVMDNEDGGHRMKAVRNWLRTLELGL